ncbi:hypothetical protein Dsin_005219 [Dipteronia sinensis]|uniref:BED-type domain-containing protein n=1 Tax=Dipteronia sinensis TaxID=43782 RepID=A0AAE0AXE9_9ROSI|nr:hypothetical protein Dsin_005219 [Dipteronia sinensis]
MDPMRIEASLYVTSSVGSSVVPSRPYVSLRPYGGEEVYGWADPLVGSSSLSVRGFLPRCNAVVGMVDSLVGGSLPMSSIMGSSFTDLLKATPIHVDNVSGPSILLKKGGYVVVRVDPSTYKSRLLGPFYDLSWEYWHPKIIFDLARGIGVPLRLDMATMEGDFGHLTRVLVDIDVSTVPPSSLLLERDASHSSFISVEYENLPAFCSICSSIGHFPNACRWNKSGKGILVSFSKSDSDRDGPTKIVTDEGFQVPRNCAPKMVFHPISSPRMEVQVSNVFAAIQQDLWSLDLDVVHSTVDSDPILSMVSSTSLVASPSFTSLMVPTTSVVAAQISPLNISLPNLARRTSLTQNFSEMNGDNDSPINGFDFSNSRGEETPNSALIIGEVKLGGEKGRQSSDSWNHFTKYQENGRMRAQCKYCPKNYACDSNTNGTTNMNKHIENQCKNYHAKLTAADPKQKCFVKQAVITSYTTLSKEGCGSSLGLGIFNKEDTRKALAEMLIADELPFRFVEKRGFRKCGRIIVRDIFQIYVDMETSLMKQFRESKVRVCLTTDTWTSIQNINYMVVTAHFIDEQWHLQKRILSFTQIFDHRGETIGKFIEQVLLNLGIDRIFTITMDNASSNKTTILYVKRKLKSWNADGLILDGNYLHLRCCAHIVNFIVNDGLKEMHDSVVAIRNAVKFVKYSPSSFENFKKYVEREKIQNKGFVVLYVPTRWNSTYLMLASALKFVKAFDRMDEEDGHYQNYFKETENEPKKIGPPNFEHWENAKLYEIYNALYGGSGASTSGGGTVDEIPLFCGGEIDDSSIFDLSVSFSETVEKQDNVRGRNEVERYLLEPVERKHPNFDVLTWWNVNSAHYPILALIAKDVFAMPISTVASESAFSGGGRVLDSFRSSLNPKMVECLICTQNWLQVTYRTNQPEDAIMNAQNDDVSLENLQFNEDAEAGK